MNNEYIRKNYTIFIKKDALREFVGDKFQVNFGEFQADLYFLYSKDRYWYLLTDLLGINAVDIFDGSYVYDKLNEIIRAKRVIEIKHFELVTSLLYILKLFNPENIIIVNEGLKGTRQWKLLKRTFYDLHDLYFWDYRDLSYSFKHEIDFIENLKEFIKYDADKSKLIKREVIEK
jgi:hypothetical protein